MHSWSLITKLINFLNLSAGILFVGPEPPIPNKIFILVFKILNFWLAVWIEFLSISIWGLLSTFKLI